MFTIGLRVKDISIWLVPPLSFAHLLCEIHGNLQERRHPIVGYS